MYPLPISSTKFQQELSPRQSVHVLIVNLPTSELKGLGLRPGIQLDQVGFLSRRILNPTQVV